MKNVIHLLKVNSQSKIKENIQTLFSPQPGNIKNNHMRSTLRSFLSFIKIKDLNTSIKNNFLRKSLRNNSNCKESERRCSRSTESRKCYSQNKIINIFLLKKDRLNSNEQSLLFCEKDKNNVSKNKIIKTEILQDTLLLENPKKENNYEKPVNNKVSKIKIFELEKKLFNLKKNKFRNFERPFHSLDGKSKMYKNRNFGLKQQFKIRLNKDKKIKSIVSPYNLGDNEAFSLEEGKQSLFSPKNIINSRNCNYKEFLSEFNQINFIKSSRSSINIKKKGISYKINIIDNNNKKINLKKNLKYYSTTKCTKPSSPFIIHRNIKYSEKKNTSINNITDLKTKKLEILYNKQNLQNKKDVKNNKTIFQKNLLYKKNSSNKIKRCIAYKNNHNLILNKSPSSKISLLCQNSPLYFKSEINFNTKFIK